MWREFLWKMGRTSKRQPSANGAISDSDNEDEDDDSYSGDSDSSGVSGHYSFRHQHHHTSRKNNNNNKNKNNNFTKLTRQGSLSLHSNSPAISMGFSQRASLVTTMTVSATTTEASSCEAAAETIADVDEDDDDVDDQLDECDEDDQAKVWREKFEFTLSLIREPRYLLAETLVAEQLKLTLKQQAYRLEQLLLRQSIQSYREQQQAFKSRTLTINRKKFFDIGASLASLASNQTRYKIYMFSFWTVRLNVPERVM